MFSMIHQIFGISFKTVNNGRFGDSELNALTLNRLPLE